jgi:hypothetical protein
MSSAQAKRLRTLRANKPREKIIEDARKAGSMSSGKFDSEKAKLAIKKRWERYHAEKAAAQQ